MKSKRPYRIQLASACPKHGVTHATIGTPYGNLKNAIREAQRLNASRIIDTAAKQVVWSKEPPSGSGEIGR